jgi:hypothetical protein
MIKAVSLGRPSLFGDNTASVAVELNSDAATLFYEALKHGGSIAAIQYNLKFDVRLPAVTIRGKIDSKQVKEVVMGYTAEKVSSEDTWGNEESHEVAHRTSIAETMESQGMVKLEILKGSVSLSQDDMESLRAFAFRAMDDFIKEHFLKGGTIETEEDRRSQWMSYLSQDITANFDLNVSYRDVVTRFYNPSSQINPSFLGAPADQVITDIDLQNAPWYYNTLNVSIDTNLDFAKYGDIVHSVIGHLSYDQAKPDGTRITERKSVLFTKDDLTKKEFKTRLADVGKDNYQVEIEVNYKSGPIQKATIAKYTTMVRHLTLNVPNPGVIEINFATPPEAFDDKLSAIEVEIEYGDSRNKVPTAVETVLLNKAAAEANYRRVIYAPWEQNYRYRITYVIKDENNVVQRSTTDWIGATPATRYVKIPTPFDEQFNLAIIPSVDWKEVRQVILDLEYDDGHDYRMKDTKSFAKEDASPTKWWKFPLRDANIRGYRYSEKWLLANGGVVEHPWITRDTDAKTLIVGNAPGGVVTVQVDPSDIGLGSEVRRVIVRLKYAEADTGVMDTETLVFRDTKPLEWTIARKKAALNFLYDVEYFMSDGSRKTLSDQTGVLSGGSSDFLFLPTPP